MYLDLLFTQNLLKPHLLSVKYNTRLFFFQFDILPE